jgi:ribonucleoside-triphosphate reductase (thioredoxin)
LSYECCTLVEVHLGRIKDKDDYLRTLKFAYLYGKTVTLLPTHWDRTNAVMQRNRRIGTSMTGIAGFSDVHGIPTFREWADDGYNSVQKYDEIYSEWLCVRPSIKTTTVKPSGSVSILSGSTPGVHWTPGGEYFLRAIRFSHTDPTVLLAAEAGYTVEDDVYSANTSVVYFPVKSDHKRSEQEVSIFEKIHLAVEAQRWWSDNAVSVTVSFKPEEKESIPTVLKMYEGQLKTVSFLPMSNDTYEQMPYQRITEQEYNGYVGKLKKIDTSGLYLNGSEPEGDKYCTTDVCELPQNIQ